MLNNAKRGQFYASLIDPDISVGIDAYIKADRQWLRSQRIQHARYQLARAADQAASEFWNEVLELNGANDG